MLLRSTEGQKGVGILIDKKSGSRLISSQGINERIALVKMEVGKEKALTLIQIYAPTSTSSESEIDNFYSDLRNCLLNQKIISKNQLVIMGDFNSQVGEREWTRIWY